jgi:hypothetical protein
MGAGRNSKDAKAAFFVEEHDPLQEAGHVLGVHCKEMLLTRQKTPSTYTAVKAHPTAKVFCEAP